MNRPDNQRPNRRELFRSVARYVALGGISLASVGLIWRGRSGRCRRLPCCRECELLARCELPEAAAAKKRGSR
ncbi:MAG: hypothetical protein HQ567_08960 [Candidatus Nealsonbacteria bacterium]|nr:hypothetical protein [Candidatus Nealsonbacteria bacterium]